MRRGRQNEAIATRAPATSALLYCHDTYGLGHLRRTLLLAEALHSRVAQLSQLIVTGSPFAHGFALPPSADYEKLPSVVKVGRDRYEPLALSLSFAALRDLRRDLLLATADHIRPDLVLVDNVPGGLDGEMTPALLHLKRVSPRTRLVLGLRDIIDAPGRVRSTWRRQGIYELLDDVYDLILVYGDPAVCDVVEAYGLSERAAAKTRYVGYLRREPDSARAAAVRSQVRANGRPVVLATAGGGGDGYALLRTLLEARRRWPEAADFDCVVFPGPFAPPREREALAELAANGARARLVDFDPDLPAYIAASDAVVSMAGYNSICEIASAGRPAVIVPRVRPRKEQLLRARAASSRGVGRMIHPSDLTPRRLLVEVNRILDRPPAGPLALPLGGLGRASQEIEALLDGKAAA